MRKAFSYFLTILVLFNVSGYYLVFLAVQHQHDKNMIARLDVEEYEQEETITIDIPITIPYATDSREFQRVDGAFEHNGKFYRLVKQKLSKDTLTVVCIKDVEKEQINIVLSGYLHTFSGHSLAQSNTKIAVSFIKDYLLDSFDIVSLASGWALSLKESTEQHDVTASFVHTILYPPEFH